MSPGLFTTLVGGMLLGAVIVSHDHPPCPQDPAREPTISAPRASHSALTPEQDLREAFEQAQSCWEALAAGRLLGKECA